VTDFSGLPGAEIVAEGLRDLASGRESVPALLVTIARARLGRLGVSVGPLLWQDTELRLYRALCTEDPTTAYARYNSLLRRLDSFARALEREQGKALRQARGSTR
jgi:hypothetical protein